MRWDRFFEDLEDQLDSEWEAERAALDTEAERLRLSRIPLRDRLVALAGSGGRVPEITADLRDGTVLAGAVTRVGADWMALSVPGAGTAAVWLVPSEGISTLVLRAEDVLATARDANPGGTLGQRMMFGFVIRDLVRRRIPVTVHLTSGRVLSGTIDRAGADHLDIAVHETGAVRRADQITGYRLIPLGAVAAVRLDAVVDLI